MKKSMLKVMTVVIVCLLFLQANMVFGLSIEEDDFNVEPGEKITLPVPVGPIITLSGDPRPN